MEPKTPHRANFGLGPPAEPLSPTKFELFWSYILCDLISFVLTQANVLCLGCFLHLHIVTESWINFLEVRRTTLARLTMPVTLLWSGPTKLWLLFRVKSDITQLGDQLTLTV